MRPIEYDEARVDELCESILKYAQDEKNLTLTMWQLETGCYRCRQAELEKKFPKFRNAKGLAKEIIGDRRERAAAEGKLPTGTVNKAMPIYNPEVREYELALRGADKQRLADLISVNLRGSMEKKEECEN